MNIKLYFSNLEDPRQKAKTQHDLIEIIAMTIIAVAGDCDGWDEIEDFCTENEEWLRENAGLKLEYGIPSADTFARVWSKLDSKEFKKSFMRWAASVRKKIKGEVVSIDGKTSRGSEDEEHNAIHMVSAWLHDQRIVSHLFPILNCLPEPYVSIGESKPLFTMSWTFPSPKMIQRFTKIMPRIIWLSSAILS